MELERINYIDSTIGSTDFWHTTEWFEYCINSRFEKGIDCSVQILGNINLKAIIPLIKEGEEFTFQGSFGPCISWEDYSPDVIKALIKHAYECDVKRIAIQGVVLGFISHKIDISIADIHNPNIRKSYKSIINKAKRNLDYTIIDSRRNPIIIYDHVSLIKAMYFKIARKVTRPEYTFELIKHWIIKGYASLIIAYFNFEPIGFILVTHYNGEAYYFLSGTLQEHKDKNVSHYLQSIAFEILKEKNVTAYVLGDINTNSLLHSPTEKELNIGFFKAGFGQIGYRMVSEYFLCKEYAKKTFEKRLENYLEAEFDA